MTPADRKAAAEMMEEVSEVDALADDDEPTSEELIVMLKQAIREVNEGKTRPAREAMRELRETMAADDNASKLR